MNHDLNNFVGVLAQVKTVPKSGYNEEDYINDALSTYHSDHGKPFRFLRPWERVKDDPKWKADGGWLHSLCSFKFAIASRLLKNVKQQ